MGFDENELRSDAIRFRSELNKIDWNKPGLSNCSKFPRGVCGTASDVLAEYLYDLGYSNIQYVYGMVGETDCSHAWIEICGVAVDVTSDQFDVHSEGVIVKNAVEFRSNYTVQGARKAGFKGERNVNDPRQIYKLVKDQIKVGE